jgi:hypothetical protein
MLTAALVAKFQALRRRFDDAAERHPHLPIYRTSGPGEPPRISVVDLPDPDADAARRELQSLAMEAESLLAKAGITGPHQAGVTPEGRWLFWVFQASIPRRVGAWQQAPESEFNELEYEELSDTAFRVSALAIDLFLAENEWREGREKPHLPVGEAKPEARPAEETAEEKVSRFLKGKPTATIDEAVAETCLTKTAISRTDAWKAHEDQLLTQFLDRNPGASAQKAADEFGCSKGKIAEMPAWKKYQEKKRPSRQAKFEEKQHQPKEEIWEVVGDEKALTPLDQLVQEEETAEVHQTIKDTVVSWPDKKERRILHNLRPDEREKLDQMFFALESLKGRPKEAIKMITRLTVEQFLVRLKEERQQEQYEEEGNK